MYRSSFSNHLVTFTHCIATFITLIVIMNLHRWWWWWWWWWCVWCRRQRDESNNVVEGSLSAEVSLVTLDMLEIIIQVNCHQLLRICRLLFELLHCCIAVQYICNMLFTVGTTGCLQLLEILEILEISWNLKFLLEILEISWIFLDAPGKIYNQQCNFCTLRRPVMSVGRSSSSHAHTKTFQNSYLYVHWYSAACHFIVRIIRRFDQCKKSTGNLLNVSWKSPGNLLGCICRHPDEDSADKWTSHFMQ